MLNAQGKLPEAIDHATIAAQLQPSPATLNTLGLVLEKGWQLDQSAQTFRQSLGLLHDPSTWVNLGNVLMTQRKWAESESAYAQAGFDNPGVLCNLAYLAFLQGDLPKAWALYEYRWQLYEPLKNIATAYGPNRLTPQNIEDVTGTIVVHCEQGYGDTLQFIRYIEPLQERTGCKVIVNCQPSLDRLLTMQNKWQVVAEPPGITHDWWCGLMSLPHILQLPCYNPGPYITAPAMNHGYKTGVVTSGNPQHPNNHNRSLPDGLLPVPKHCLDLRPDHCPLPITDWATTAIMIAGLDRVVTVDTGVMHLAAAMGKPTTGLISYRPDPRWGCISSDSPWYPSLSLLRQATGNDWSPCITSAMPLLV